MSRYNSFVNLINAGGYKLADIKERLHGLADRGELTLEERDKLLGMAESHADPLSETDKGAKLLDLEARLRKVEEQLAALAGDTTEPPTDENGDTVIAGYVAGKWYYAGDKVTWDGKVYECIAPEGVVCVWSPGDYPAYWREAAD